MAGSPAISDTHRRIFGISFPSGNKISFRVKMSITLSRLPMHLHARDDVTGMLPMNNENRIYFRLQIFIYFFRPRYFFYLLKDEWPFICGNKDAGMGNCAKITLGYLLGTGYVTGGYQEKECNKRSNFIHNSIFVYFWIITKTSLLIKTNQCVVTLNMKFFFMIIRTMSVNLFNITRIF